MITSYTQWHNYRIVCGSPLTGLVCWSVPVLDWVRIGLLGTFSFGEENFPNWFAIPKNLHNSLTFVGVGIDLRAAVFCGSASIPSLLTMC